MSDGIHGTQPSRLALENDMGIRMSDYREAVEEIDRLRSGLIAMTEARDLWKQEQTKSAEAHRSAEAALTAAEARATEAERERDEARQDAAMQHQRADDWADFSLRHPEILPPAVQAEWFAIRCRAEAAESRLSEVEHALRDLLGEADRYALDGYEEALSDARERARRALSPSYPETPEKESKP